MARVPWTHAPSRICLRVPVAPGSLPDASRIHSRLVPLPVWLGLWQGRVLGMPGYRLVSGLSQGMLARTRVVATMGDLSSNWV